MVAFPLSARRGHQNDCNALSTHTLKPTSFSGKPNGDFKWGDLNQSYIVTKTQLLASIWTSLCHLFDNLTAKGSPCLVTIVLAELIMQGLSLLFSIFFLPLFFGLICPGQCWQCCLWRRCIRNSCPLSSLIFPRRSVVGFGGASHKKSRYP